MATGSVMMADKDLLVDTSSEQQPAQTATSHTDRVEGNAAAAAPHTQAAAPSKSTGSFLTRLFQGSGLRRPSKIPRLQKQQSSVSVASTVDHVVTESKISTSSVASIASSSRETTPFSSPTKSRLREPSKLRSRKRPREETLESVVDRLEREQREDALECEPYSQELSSQTNHDDVASVASYRGEEEESERKDDEDHRRAQELAVAKGLQQHLLRGRARLRLKISSLKDDVEVYYELLARMEQVTMVAKSHSVDVEGHATREEMERLADRIQGIISAQAVPSSALQKHHSVFRDTHASSPDTEATRDQEEGVEEQ